MYDIQIPTFWSSYSEYFYERAHKFQALKWMLQEYFLSEFLCEKDGFSSYFTQEILPFPRHHTFAEVP